MMSFGRLHVGVWLLVALSILWLSSGFAQQDDQAAMNDLRQQWQDFYNARDAAGVAGLYTEDAVLYDADGSVLEGRQAIQEHIQGEMDAELAQLTLESIETQMTGDVGHDIGRWTATSGEGEAFGGYYLAVLTREDGEWRISRHMVNFVMPEGEMMNEGGGGAN